jgi:hypothetical protein
VVCANAGAAAINTPITLKNANLNFLISLFLSNVLSSAKEEIESGSVPYETPHFMISPASGMQPPLVQRRSSDAGTLSQSFPNKRGKLIIKASSPGFPFDLGSLSLRSVSNP